MNNLDTPLPWNYHSHKVIYDDDDTQGAFLPNRDYFLAVCAVNSCDELIQSMKKFLASDTSNPQNIEAMKSILAKAESLTNKKG